MPLLAPEDKAVADDAVEIREGDAVTSGPQGQLEHRDRHLVHEFTVSAEGADPSWERAALYRARNADFFLCGRGGSESRWRLPDGAAPRHEDIAFVSADEARALLEAHGQFETVEAYLAAEVPGEVRLSVRLSGVMAAKLEATAKADRRLANAWIVDAIEERLTRTKIENAPEATVSNARALARGADQGAGI